MINFLNLLIPGLFYFLFFTVPLILYPYTSELFEFNKMILVYLLTALIVGAWLIKCILAKKIIFRRTILDIPLLIFLGTQLLSTIFSIDFRTSLLGYYSRFHGGLLSLISYLLLYWTFVSSMDKGKTFRAIKILFISALLVSLYGIMERLGIDKNIWVQDVQSRVFSTLGQPNWLAAWLVALIPLGLFFFLQENPLKKIKINNPFSNSKILPLFFEQILFLSAPVIFFITLLFTKSRSGIIGFIVADIIFWIFYFLKSKKQIFTPLIVHNSLFLILILFIGTPWTPNLKQMLATDYQTPIANQGPALEVGGTESGEIRKIVWKGAVEIWKHYPIFGTGVETFAYSYYNFRPVEHNLVSEWDFLYNKAHNEYLNYLATTGTLGFLAYFVLIGFSLYQIIKITNKNKEGYLLNYSLFECYVSILITKFLCFSVVPVALLFFLFPALAITANNPQLITNKQINKITANQKIILSIVIVCVLWIVLAIGRYWYADILYNKGQSLNDQQKYVEAREDLARAIKLSPSEAIFYDEFSQSSAGIALALNQIKENDKAKDFVIEAITQSQKAINLSPANVNLKRSQISLFFKLTLIDSNYLLNAKEILLTTIKQAPTDAKLFYNLGLTYARIGDSQSSLQTLEKTIEIKPNYRDARFAYALLLVDKKEYQKAKEQLQYILEKIDPHDTLAQQQLEELK
jgi:putative inorganic carbon (HCO3(-)) transporter